MIVSLELPPRPTPAWHPAHSRCSRITCSMMGRSLFLPPRVSGVPRGLAQGRGTPSSKCEVSGCGLHPPSAAVLRAPTRPVALSQTCPALCPPSCSQPLVPPAPSPALSCSQRDLFNTQLWCLVRKASRGSPLPVPGLELNCFSKECTPSRKTPLNLTRHPQCPRPSD